MSGKGRPAGKEPEFDMRSRIEKEIKQRYLNQIRKGGTEATAASSRERTEASLVSRANHRGNGVRPVQERTITAPMEVEHQLPKTPSELKRQQQQEADQRRRLRLLEELEENNIEVDILLDSVIHRREEVILLSRTLGSLLLRWESLKQDNGVVVPQKEKKNRMEWIRYLQEKFPSLQSASFEGDPPSPDLSYSGPTERPREAVGVALTQDVFPPEMFQEMVEEADEMLSELGLLVQDDEDFPEIESAGEGALTIPERRRGRRKSSSHHHRRRRSRAESKDEGRKEKESEPNTPLPKEQNATSEETVRPNVVPLPSASLDEFVFGREENQSEAVIRSLEGRLAREAEKHALDVRLLRNENEKLLLLLKEKDKAIESLKEIAMTVTKNSKKSEPVAAPSNVRPSTDAAAAATTPVLSIERATSYSPAKGGTTAHTDPNRPHRELWERYSESATASRHRSESNDPKDDPKPYQINWNRFEIPDVPPPKRYTVLPTEESSVNSSAIIEVGSPDRPPQSPSVTLVGGHSPMAERAKEKYDFTFDRSLEKAKLSALNPSSSSKAPHTPPHWEKEGEGCRWVARSGEAEIIRQYNNVNSRYNSILAPSPSQSLLVDSPKRGSPRHKNNNNSNINDSSDFLVVEKPKFTVAFDSRQVRLLPSPQRNEGEESLIQVDVSNDTESHAVSPPPKLPSTNNRTELLNALLADDGEDMNAIERKRYFNPPPVPSPPTAGQDSGLPLPSPIAASREVTSMSPEYIQKMNDMTTSSLYKAPAASGADGGEGINGIRPLPKLSGQR